MIEIFRALVILFSPPLSRQWPKLPNAGPLFGGARPIDFAIQGGLPHLLAIRAELEALMQGAWGGRDLGPSARTNPPLLDGSARHDRHRRDPGRPGMSDALIEHRAGAAAWEAFRSSVSGSAEQLCPLLETETIEKRATLEQCR